MTTSAVLLPNATATGASTSVNSFPATGATFQASGTTSAGADGAGNNVWEPGVFGWTKV